MKQKQRRRSAPAESRQAANPPVKPSWFQRYKRRDFWMIVLLIAATLAVYAQVGRYEFVTFDDPQYVTNNPRVTGGLSWSAAEWAFTTGHQANWHPLTWLSHMLDVELFGVTPGPQHIVN